MHQKGIFFSPLLKIVMVYMYFFLQLNVGINTLSNKEFSIYYSKCIIREGRPKDNLSAECGHD